MDTTHIPECWQAALADQFAADYFVELSAFVDAERQSHPVYPPAEDVFNALSFTPVNNVRVVILGQDPYHGEGQAHGLSFSVRRGVKQPPSLKNIFKEVQSDLGIEPPDHGCLESWAKQGVLLLNTVLTVRASEANSHRKKGWEQFTDAIIARVNDLERVAFVLWGKPAQKKADRISDRHLVHQSPHPSPLSARTGFFGSKPFSTANQFLEHAELEPINWSTSDPSSR